MLAIMASFNSTTESSHHRLIPLIETEDGWKEANPLLSFPRAGLRARRVLRCNFRLVCLSFLRTDRAARRRGCCRVPCVSGSWTGVRVFAAADGSLSGRETVLGIETIVLCQAEDSLERLLWLGKIIPYHIISS